MVLAPMVLRPAGPRQRHTDCHGGSLGAVKSACKAAVYPRRLALPTTEKVFMSSETVYACRVDTGL
jgi:hypothetical protein